MLWQYYDEDCPNGGIECRLGMKSRYFLPVSHFIMCCHCCSCLDVINTEPPDRGKLVVLIPGSSKRWSLLMAGDDEVFITRSLSVTLRTTEQHLIVSSGKSEAEVAV